MHRIVFLDRGTMSSQIQLGRLHVEYELVEHANTRPDELLQRMEGATIAITNKVPLSRDILQHLPSLQLIAVAATGTDVIDKAWCAANGIAVCNIRGYALNTVPEHTFALMLTLRRSVLAYNRDVLRGRWQDSGQFCFFDHAIRDLAGTRLGIVGDGILGRRVAEIARAFGMVPLFAAHKGAEGMGPLYTPWQEMLETSDVITLHAPLTTATRGMIGRTEFLAMKRTPLLINTARGGLVDEAALVEALDRGWISGAGFDVAEIEPPPKEHPIMRVAAYPNVIITPHVAWASEEAQQALADQLTDNIDAFCAGSPKNLVHDA